MKKLIVSFGAALALMLGMFTFTGCSDNNPVDNGSTVSESDPYEVYKISEEDIADFSEVPTFDELMNGSFAKPGQREFGKLIVASYIHKIKQLDLTDDQKAQIKLCFADHRSCVKDAATTYRDARNALFSGLREDLIALRGQVLDSTLTREEARAQMQDLVTTYRENLKPYAESFRESVKGCAEAFKECVAGVLTAEQLDLWNSMQE